MIIAKFFYIILMLMIPAFIAGVSTVIYLPAYKRKINMRLGEFGESGLKDRRPVTSPVKFFFISYLAGFIVLAVLITMFIGRSKGGNTSLGQVSEPYCWIEQVVTESMLDSYTAGDEIPGYRLTSSKKENGFEFYFYSGNGGSVSGFPDALIGIKNTNGSEAFYMDIKAEQRNAIYPDYDGGFAANCVENPVMWCTLDTFNFFGTLDITLETMNKPEADSYLSFEELKDIGTGKTLQMHIELDKELGIEGWYTDR